MFDTICSIATTLGVGAISIIRVSGKEAISIVNNIFKGKDLEKVADYFHVTVDYLLGRTDDPLGSGEKSADLDDDTVLFTYQGKPLSDEDRKKMLEIFRLMEKGNDK